MQFLLVTPPLSQLNTPYPATATLKGFLQREGHPCAQADLGIELVDAVFRRHFLHALFEQAQASGAATRQPWKTLLRRSALYCDLAEPALRFLRGEDDTLAARIASRRLLPEGPRFRQVAGLDWAFGNAGTLERARHIATLFLEDIADFIRENIDPHFDLVRYAERLADYAPTFDGLAQAMQQPPTAIDRAMLDLLQQHVKASAPHIVGLSVPFPGCLYGALRCGQWLRQRCPDITVCIGGGFANTEWRSLNEPRLFQYCHYVTLDDGELPLLRIAQRLRGEDAALVRTYCIHDGTVTYSGHDAENLPFATYPAPDFSGLPMDKYLALSEMTNPMHRLWNSGRWVKMAMAHGCYWHGCAFCDTTLDYIGRYEAPTAQQTVARMQAAARSMGTGQGTGFHFVDEALPPRLLGEVCEELLRQRYICSFWGNIRFEKVYTLPLCELMAQAGCIAVSGGLEVASDRLLKLMNKGVTIEQTLAVLRNFKKAGIMVHTYLMYGFPTETLQETIDALEVVRRMFAEGLVQSAFWHRYAMTCHSPSGQHAEAYGVRRTSLEPHPFCNNEVDFQAMDGAPSPFPYDIDAVGEGLRFALFNYMNGVGLDLPLRRWFSIPVPKPRR